MTNIFDEDPILAEIFRDGLTARRVKSDPGMSPVSGMMSMRPLTMRLMKLTLENFRAFRGEVSFDFQGRNVLVFGENGSGKTSMWSALDLFLNAALGPSEEKSRALFAKYRYQFNRKPGRVEFEVLDERGDYLPDAVWSRDDTPFQHPAFAPSARVSARLDYRSLWETYFLQRESREVDIWPLLIQVLLPHYLTLNNEPLAQEWDEIQRQFSRVTIVNLEEHVEDDEEETLLSHAIARQALLSIIEFNASLENTLREIKRIADAIFTHLSPGMTFSWEITAATQKPSTTSKTLILHPPKVIVSVQLPGQNKPLKHHQNLLNEARLSALALSIYFAAAQVNAEQARSGFKILALDDVLIGLDMSNRERVLDLLKGNFRGWQVFLFTYDRAWFELASDELEEERWKKFEFYASPDVPICLEGQTLLEKSHWYLEADAQTGRAPDVKAAGVYARSAFETMLKSFYKAKKLPLVYKPSGHYELGELWPDLEQLEKEGPNGTRVPLLEPELWKKVENAKKRHFNPLCHSQPLNYHKHEVQRSLKILEELEKVLNQASKVRPKPAPVPTGEIDFPTCHETKLKAVFYQAQREMIKRGLLS